jgi:hypothetical protein
VLRRRPVLLCLTLAGHQNSVCEASHGCGRSAVFCGTCDEGRVQSRTEAPVIGRVAEIARRELDRSVGVHQVIRPVSAKQL